MRLSFLLASLFALALLPEPARADERCRNIVSATVAELRAGAAAWDDAIEALARTAAGSACVKALSGTYGSAEGTGGGEQVAAVTATPDASAEQSATAGEEGAAEAKGAAEAEEEASEKKDGKAGWKFLGFEVNEIGGSPGRKPYERRRSQ